MVDKLETTLVSAVKPSGVIERFQAEIARLYNDVANKEERIRGYRAEASRLASIANKRAARLESNDLTDSPAYKTYIEGGKFSVRGKTHNELQQEVSRLTRFLNSTTSTVRGVNNTLKELASNTGISYNNLKDLRAKAAQFFELASKVEQYLRQVEDVASAIGYQKIWEAINQYVQNESITLGSDEVDIDSMIANISAAITEYDSPIKKLGGNGWFTLK